MQVLLAFCNTNTASHHITSTLTHGPLKSLNPEMQDFPLRSYHRILCSRNRLWNSEDYDSCALRWQSDPRSHGQSHLAWASAFQQNAVEVFSCALMQQCHFMQLHDCASKAKFLAALAAMHLAANIEPSMVVVGKSVKHTADSQHMRSRFLVVIFGDLRALTSSSELRLVLGALQPFSPLPGKCNPKLVEGASHCQSCSSLLAFGCPVLTPLSRGRSLLPARRSITQCAERRGGTLHRTIKT